ncbi:FecCD family ABC transporter permease [Methanolobus psychrotolerans]|uniref:FecCD family ABC transporter permease n=1 Tax=Methanolobus psychrotolerans TaxID=1874706 RepID=UPI000B9183FC|nr:iron ABC transporter permease [Methanolobus psychrotolerans]
MPDLKRYGTICIYLLPLVLLFSSLFVGRYQISSSFIIDDIVRTASFLLFATDAPISTEHTVLFSIRLPRILAALMAGSALSISGAAFQGIFRNPLVSPDILGVGAGAGFGACIAILLYDSYLAIQLLSFIFGLVAVFAAVIMGKVSKGTGTLVFVLAGIIVASIFNAFISLVKYVADPYNDLPAIVFWFMGSLSSIRYNDLHWVILPMLVGSLVLLLLRWRINILSLGDEEARSLGVNAGRMRLIIIICATLVTSAAVSISGVIGWVGLVVPHISRMIVGPNYNRLLPMSMVIGASFMLLVDNLARTVAATEIPLGIITSLLGAPLFAYLLKRGRMGWI